LITKYWSLVGDASTFFLIDPDTLELTAQLDYPGASPRLTVVPARDGNEYLYHLNTRETFRMRIEQGGLTLDPDWVARFDPYGTGQEENEEPTSPVVVDDRVFYTTNTVFSVTDPMRIFWQDVETQYRKEHTPLTGPELFAGVEGGGWSFFSIAIDEFTGIIVSADQGNGLLTAVRAIGDNEIERLWQLDLHTSASPVIVSDREMVYANDFVDGRDHLVVLDLTTGEEILRVPTPATRATISEIIVSSANEVYFGSNEPGQPIGLFHRIYVP
jgi:outer membrane protein assembly factor BamB